MYDMMYKCSAASYHVQESNQQLALVNGLELDQNKRVTGLFTVLGQYIQKQQQQQKYTNEATKAYPSFCTHDYVFVRFNLTFILTLDIYVRAFVNLEPRLSILDCVSQLWWKNRILIFLQSCEINPEWNSDFSPKLRDKIRNGILIFLRSCETKSRMESLGSRLHAWPAHTKHSHIQKTFYLKNCESGMINHMCT